MNEWAFHFGSRYSCAEFENEFRMYPRSEDITHIRERFGRTLINYIQVMLYKYVV